MHVVTECFTHQCQLCFADYTCVIHIDHIEEHPAPLTSTQLLSVKSHSLSIAAYSRLNFQRRIFFSQWW